MEENYEIAYDFATEAYKKFQNVIKSIVLFGSVAKNLKTQNDIDIIIFVDDCTIQWDDELIAWYREELQKILANNKNRDKLHVNTVTLSVFWDEFKTGEPVAINIVRYGKSLIDFGGFFEPLKILLARGKVKPSAEAVYNALRRAPINLSRARYNVYLIMDSLYWAMVDSAHAALMMAEQIAPSPEHIPGLLDEHFVRKKMLNKYYTKLYREIYEIIHSANKTGIKIPSKKIDEYQREVEKFVSEMTEIVRKLEK